MPRPIQEQIERLQRGYNAKPRDLPKHCYRRGPYLYFIVGGMIQRMPEPDDPKFPRSYRDALLRAPRRNRSLGPELFKHTNMTAFDLRQIDSDLLRGAKGRAGRSGRDMELPDGWVFDTYLAQKGRCAISKQKMRKPIEPWDNFGPSLDRIDSNGGYTLENCHLTLVAVNLAKRAMSLEDFAKICTAVANQSKRKV